MSIDLNRLREMVLRNQQSGEVAPTDPNRLVVVDKNGTILTGDEAAASRGPTVVPQETFAAGAAP